MRDIVEEARQRERPVATVTLRAGGGCAAISSSLVVDDVTTSLPPRSSISQRKRHQRNCVEFTDGTLGPNFGANIRPPASTYNRIMPQPVTLESVVRVSPHVVSATVAGEIVVLDPDTAKYYGVEGAGIEVWRMLDAPRLVRDLLERLLSVYDVASEECERDLLDLLGRMLEDGLVELVEQ